MKGHSQIIDIFLQIPFGLLAVRHTHFQIDLVLESTFLAGHPTPITFRIYPRAYAISL